MRIDFIRYPKSTVSDSLYTRSQTVISKRMYIGDIKLMQRLSLVGDGTLVIYILTPKNILENAALI